MTIAPPDEESPSEKRPPKNLGSIRGVVAWDLGGEGIAGVTVTLSPTGATATTGADGRFTFSNVPLGQYTLDARGTAKGRLVRGWGEVNAVPSRRARRDADHGRVLSDGSRVAEFRKKWVPTSREFSYEVPSRLR